jgi:hypothetical protein
MRTCVSCGQRIPAHVVAVLTGGTEKGSGPGIPRWRHEECAPPKPATIAAAGESR